MNLPKYSVIIPVFNGANFLAETLSSVAVQKIKPTEIILVDDGSGDGSADLGAALALELKLTLQCYRQENKGPAAARNLGICRASTNYLTFLDADDLWDLNKMDKQFALLERAPDAQFTWGQVCLFEMRGSQRLQLGKPSHRPNLGSALFHRSAFEAVGLFDESMRCSEDLDWFLRAREKNVHYVEHPDIVLWYRQHENNTWLGTPNPNRAQFLALKKKIDRKRAENF